MDTKLNGYVKWWHEGKGHGFAACEDGSEVFIRFNYFVKLAEGKRISVIEGQRLRFNVKIDPKGPRGDEIEIL